MDAMSIRVNSAEPAPEDPAVNTEPATDESAAQPVPEVIFQDPSHSPLPIRDPKSASLIFRPFGQGCFP
jgi:hypothetical protein